MHGAAVYYLPKKYDRLTNTAVQNKKANDLKLPEGEGYADYVSQLMEKSMDAILAEAMAKTPGNLRYDCITMTGGTRTDEMCLFVSYRYI